MMSIFARVPSIISSSTSESPGKRSYGSQNPWIAKSEREDRTGQPVVGSDPKTASGCCHEQSVGGSFSARYSKWDDNQAWSSQEWKTGIETCERSGRHDKISWRMIRKVRLGLSHEEILLDGTAQSVMNDVILRDRTERLDIDSQDKAWLQQFVIGNDEAELELSVESRSFVNDQVRKRQKRNSTLTEIGEKNP